MFDIEPTGPFKFEFHGPFITNESGEVECEGVDLRMDEQHAIRYFACLPERYIGIVYNTNIIEMYETQSIYGKVILPEGFSPEHVTIKLLSLHLGGYRLNDIGKHIPYVNVNVNSNGEFLYPAVPDDGYVILGAEGEGLAQAQFAVTGHDTGTWNTHLFNSDRVFTSNQIPEIIMEEEGNISGKVTYEDGSPAAGYTVKVYPQDVLNQFGVESPFVTTTQPDGSYKIGGLPYDYYSIRVDTGSQDFTPSDWTSSVVSMVVAKTGEIRENTDIVLEKGAIVQGRVINESGTAVPRARISAMNPVLPAHEKGALNIGTAETDREGKYALRLPVGETKLSFEYLPGYVFPENEKIITVQPGGESKVLDFIVK